MIRILAVSYWFPPAESSQAIQVGRLVRHWPAEAVMVCAGAHPGRTTSGSLNVRTVSHTPPKNDWKFRLARYLWPYYATVPDEYLSWRLPALAAIETTLSDPSFFPDVVVTFGEPMTDHLLGVEIKSRWGLPWVAHFSDPWVDCSYRRPFWLSRSRNVVLEKKVFKKVDGVVFTSEETRGMYLDRYPSFDSRRTVVVPHSFEPGPATPTKAPAAPLVLRFVGRFFGHRQPYDLARAVKKLLRENPQILNNVTIELVGHLSRIRRAHPALLGLPPSLWRWRPLVTYARSLELMADSDLLVLIDGKEPWNVFFPGKLADYIGAGKPIFALTPPGTSARIVGRLGGVVADPHDPRATVRGLSTALVLAREWRQQNGAPWGSSEERKKYEAVSNGRRMVRLLERMVSQKTFEWEGGLL